LKKSIFYIIVLITFCSLEIFAQNSNSVPLSFTSNRSILLNKPSNFNNRITYSNETNQYYLQNRIGKLDFGRPQVLNFNGYQSYNFNKSIKKYWSSRSKEKSGSSNFSLGLPKLFVPGKAFDKIFGGNAVDIRPQGSAELIFGLKVNKLENPSLPEEQRRTTTFDFQEKIQMNVIGKIGDKLKLTTNFNTESTFDFENQMKLEICKYLLKEMFRKSIKKYLIIFKIQGILMVQCQVI